VIGTIKTDERSWGPVTWEVELYILATLVRGMSVAGNSNHMFKSDQMLSKTRASANCTS
jgi:hypothetical protein